MVYNSDSVENERRVRVIIYYKYDKNPYFLLLDRRSEIHPGWEFVKGDFDEKKDKTLEDTLYREVLEETGLTKEDFIFKPVKFDLNLPSNFLTYIDGVQAVNYLLEVGYPPPRVKPSEEHIRVSWFDPFKTFLKIGNRSTERSGDLMIFPRVFLSAQDMGYL